VAGGSGIWVKEGFWRGEKEEVNICPIIFVSDFQIVLELKMRERIKLFIFLNNLLKILGRTNSSIYSETKNAPGHHQK